MAPGLSSRRKPDKGRRPPIDPRESLRGLGMNDAVSIVEEVLAAPHDYWDRARRGLQGAESLDGLLPASRELPDCPEAAALVAEGRAARRPLLEIVRQEREGTLAFRNAVFLLMYFDCLFVYRELKALYAEASPEQRPWLDVACRKVLLRCLETPETAHDPLTREIVRNTWRGRLATTKMIVDLVERSFGQCNRKIIVRDTAVSDGVTTLDLAEEAARRGVAVSITATDLRMYLLYAGRDGNEVVGYSDGEPCQYVIGGQTYGVRHAEVPAALRSAQVELDRELRGLAAERITMLAPQVDHAVRTGELPLRFKEEDAFDPDPDIGDADIIRIANLLVERSADHRGYYYRQGILAAISRLGTAAKDGAYLYLDNFRKKVEHVGLWRKDAAAGEWTRLPVAGDVAVDLDGVAGIPIERVAGE